MAFIEDTVAVVRSSWMTTGLVGVGAVVLAPLVLPVVGAGLGLVAKTVIKGGMLVVGAAQTVVATAGEQASALWTEAWEEMHPGQAMDMRDHAAEAQAEAATAGEQASARWTEVWEEMHPGQADQS